MTYELPPKVQIDKHIPTGIVIYGYTAEHVLAAYDKGLEDAAKVCRSHVLRTLTREEAASQAQGNATAYDCENAILAMKVTP